MTSGDTLVIISDYFQMSASCVEWCTWNNWAPKNLEPMCSWLKNWHMLFDASVRRHGLSYTSSNIAPEALAQCHLRQCSSSSCHQEPCSHDWAALVAYSRIQGFKDSKDSKNFYSINIHKKYSITINWTIPRLYWSAYQSSFRYIIEGNKSLTEW